MSIDNDKNKYNRSNQFKADRSFQDLAINIKGIIERNDGLVGDQKDQVELLMSLERKFQHFIQKYQQTYKIYEKFVLFITQDVGNILTAQSYFRERNTVFSSDISNIFKQNDYRKIGEQKINFQLIDFIAKNWKGSFPDIPNRYYNEYLEARRVLIENNLPLAINRAKLFYRKTQNSHLSLLDLIGICTDGLIVGIDKYADSTYHTRWRSVCIGRMTGFMIKEYSKTFIKMSPKNNKILYRANSLRFRLKLEKISDIARAVNESFELEKADGKPVPPLPISENEINNLLNGASYVSTDTLVQDSDVDGEGVGVYDLVPSDYDVEEEVSNHEALDKVSKKFKHLDIKERKVIKLKGVLL